MGRYSAPLAPQLAELVRVDAGQRVLDVGCGPGALTAELVKRVGADLVTAVDPSEPFVAATGARHPGGDRRRATRASTPAARPRKASRSPSADSMPLSRSSWSISCPTRSPAWLRWRG